MLTSSLDLIERFRPEYLEYYGVLPLDLIDGCLRVATCGDIETGVASDFERTFDAEIQPLEVTRDEVVQGIRAHFAAAESTGALARAIDAELTGAPGPSEADARTIGSDTRDLANQPPVIRFVNLLIREAHDAGASDVHLESTSQGPAVRFRVDGVMCAATAPPSSIHAAVVSRLKLIADLDIAERRIPQDGRIRVRLDRTDLDLRVSTVPTLFGESIVLRLLDRGGAPESLAELGMAPTLLDQFLHAVRRSHGIVLATGPTGSGKTTTLYGALRLRDAGREKIITIEDPVEYRLPGITQVPVNRKAGMTFGAGLRSLLRQDPDVIMVGEMRDQETARIAVQAAMTGHLVFSTVHTNDAASAVTRMTDLGVEPYLVAATLQGVLAQRLVRRTCVHCVEEVPPDEYTRSLLSVVDADHRFMRGVGCAVCRQAGYRGRVGLFEWLEVTPAHRSDIARDGRVPKAASGSEEHVVTTMRDDGREKVLAGITTAMEVLRVLGA